MENNRAELKDYAKNLYLEFNNKGKRKHTLQQIAEMVQQKFNVEKIDKSTISRWSRADGWDIILQEIKNRGIEQAINRAREKDEAVKDAKAEEFSIIYKSEADTYKLAKFLLNSRLHEMVRKLKEGELTIDQLVMDEKDLSYIARLSLENMSRMDGNKQDDPLLELFRRLDAEI